MAVKPDMTETLQRIGAGTQHVPIVPQFIKTVAAPEIDLRGSCLQRIGNREMQGQAQCACCVHFNSNHVERGKYAVLGEIEDGYAWANAASLVRFNCLNRCALLTVRQTRQDV
jgi:hypothetical protein